MPGIRAGDHERSRVVAVRQVDGLALRIDHIVADHDLVVDGDRQGGDTLISYHGDRILLQGVTHVDAADFV